MIKRFSQINPGAIIIVIVVVLFGIFLGSNITNISFRQLLLTTFFLIIAGAVLIKPDLGLFIIIVSALLSPEFSIGNISGREVTVRIEDLLLIVVTFSWLVKTAVDKEIGIFKSNPLSLAIAVFALACLIATLLGIFSGKVLVLKGFFYFLKYIEYFILYFMVVNQLKRKSQIKMFLFFFFLTCAITCVYGYSTIGQGRLSAPFEGEVGEPNTLGGYIMFMIAIAAGIFSHSRVAITKVWLGAFILFTIPIFLLTLSRTAYVSIIPMWITLIIFGPKKRLLSFILIWVVILGAFFMPAIVQERLEYTFTGRAQAVESVKIGNVKLDPSFSERIHSWGNVWKDLMDRPIFGYGITGLGFIDGQYIRNLGELGLVGFITFLFLLRSVYRNTRQNLLSVKDELYKGLSLGFLAGFIGLLFFNIGANGFILIRIMEPFWFICGMVMVLPKIYEDEQQMCYE